MASTEKLDGLWGREKIRDRVARVTREEDRRSASPLRATSWPAATDVGVSSRAFDECLAWTVPGSPAMPATQPGETVFGKGASA